MTYRSDDARYSSRAFAQRPDGSRQDPYAGLREFLADPYVPRATRLSFVLRNYAVLLAPGREKRRSLEELALTSD